MLAFSRSLPGTRVAQTRGVEPQQSRAEDVVESSSASVAAEVFEPRRPDDPDKPIPFPVPVDIRSVSLTGLFVLAVLYTLYFASSFLVPLAFALLLSHLLSPVVRALRRAGIPDGAGAALVLVAFLGTVGVAVYELSAPATQWIMSAPESLPKIQAKLAGVLKPVQRMSRTAEKVKEATDLDGQKALEVEVKGPSVTDTIFGNTQQIVGGLFVVVLLLLLLLGSGDLFLTKVIKVIPRLSDKKKAVQIARETQSQISTYLFTTTLVNVAFGVVVGIAMYLLGMPNPVLWGVLAGVTNFVPYLGAVLCTVILGAVALLHYDSVGHALVVPAVFQFLNIIEGNYLTPMLIGRQLSLSPVVIFTAVLFWGWIWGIPGALLAIPITAVIKIACDHIEGLSALGEFLGH
jgi:predicted PurR-regulated permease PerM